MNAMNKNPIILTPWFFGALVVDWFGFGFRDNFDVLDVLKDTVFSHLLDDNVQHRIVEGFSNFDAFNFDDEVQVLHNLLLDFFYIYNVTYRRVVLNFSWKSWRIILLDYFPEKT